MTDSAASPAAAASRNQAEPQARSLVSDWRLHLALIVALALIPRAIYLAQIHHWPFFYYPILDSRTQNAWAETLVRTWGLGNNEVLAKPPLYAYFLAFAKLSVGTGNPSLFAARLLQLLLGALTCGLTYLIGRRVFGLAAGLLAGLLLAFFSPGIFAEGELLDTALATFLATSFLLALLSSLDRPTAARWFGAGLLLALLGLTRGNLLLLLPLALVLLVLWLRGSQRRAELARLAGLFVLGALLPILVITARNYLLMHGLIPISSNGGINFYTGNNPQADGFSPIPSGIAWERTWYEQTKAGALTIPQQDRYWRSKALAFWRGQPGKALALTLKKAYLYWGAYEIPNNLSFEWGRAHASLLRAIPFTFAIVGPLGLLGIALGGWRTRGAQTLTLVIATQMVAVIAFFVCGRYRMPALPALSVFAGFALVQLVGLARSRRWPALGLAVAGLGAFATLVNADLYGVGRARGANRDWVFLAQSLAQQGKLSHALAAAQRAVEQDPREADAWSLMGNMALQLGDPEAAVRAFRQALRAAPDYGNSAARLAEVYLDLDRPLAEPKRLVERALVDQPNNVNALAALVRVEVRLGDLTEARDTLKKMAQAFRMWDPRDSRYPATQAAVQYAAAEASSAGLPVPQLLRPTPQPQRPHLMTGE